MRKQISNRKQQGSDYSIDVIVQKKETSLINTAAWTWSFGNKETSNANITQNLPLSFSDTANINDICKNS